MFFLILVCTFYSTKKLIGDRIREEYEKINNFDKSQTGQLMNRYRKITLCKDCRYRAKGKSGYHYCRTGFGLPVVPLRENDGCSRGEER